MYTSHMHTHTHLYIIIILCAVYRQLYVYIIYQSCHKGHVTFGTCMLPHTIMGWFIKLNKLWVGIFFFKPQVCSYCLYLGKIKRPGASFKSQWYLQNDNALIIKLHPARTSCLSPFPSSSLPTPSLPPSLPPYMTSLPPSIPPLPLVSLPLPPSPTFLLPSLPYLPRSLTPLPTSLPI